MGANFTRQHSQEIDEIDRAIAKAPGNLANVANNVAGNIALNALRNLQNSVQPPPETMRVRAPASGGNLSTPSHVLTPASGYSSGIPHAPRASPFFFPHTTPNQYLPRRGPLYEITRVSDTPPSLLPDHTVLGA